MSHLAILALLLTSMLAVVNGHLTTVPWGPGINYTEWASDKEFFVNDWIGFFFDTHHYSVLEVNQTNYENCNETDYITNVSKDGKDVLQLVQARPYYFISGLGQCHEGVKLSINVKNAPAPQPSPSKNASPGLNTSLLASALLILLAWALI